jgi:hypothetical protein
MPAPALTTGAEDGGTPAHPSMSGPLPGWQPDDLPMGLPCHVGGTPATGVAK